MLLTVRKKSSFLKTVETGKWFCKPPSHTCQEQGSFSPGMPELGGGATGEAPLRLPKCPMGRAQLGPGRSCGWYQIRHLLMTASDPSAFVSKLLVKGGRCLQPCLKWKDAERFGGHKTIQWPRDEMRFLSLQSSAPRAHSSALQRPTTALTKRALSPRHTTHCLLKVYIHHLFLQLVKSQILHFRLYFIVF